MRQGPGSKRRGRNGRKPGGGGGNVRSHLIDSNGPNVRIRGNAYQVWEKYLALARDATSAGDRIAAENYYQHAEHYLRVLSANGGPPENRNGQFNRPEPSDGNGAGFDDDSDGSGDEEETESAGEAQPA